MNIAQKLSLMFANGLKTGLTRARVCTRMFVRVDAHVCMIDLVHGLKNLKLTFDLDPALFAGRSVNAGPKYLSTKNDKNILRPKKKINKIKLTKNNQNTNTIK
jgi:hypothetical protein